ncbi:MAG: hypothetical protein IT531_06280 [Burkholderiales bacterium]|nr:hypothetical protein [Burkholderiales bacterium]
MAAGFDIVNPIARVSSADAALASPPKRIGQVEGLRIGLLDNGMPHAADFLTHLGAAFERRYRTPILMRRKGFTARGAEPQIIDEMASCDAVVTGFGV